MLFSKGIFNLINKPHLNEYSDLFNMTVNVVSLLTDGCMNSPLSLGVTVTDICSCLFNARSTLKIQEQTNQHLVYFLKH